MTARWQRVRHSSRAHLLVRDPAVDYRSACGTYWPERFVLPDDGRPRCKRCLAAEVKAKEGKHG